MLNRVIQYSINNKLTIGIFMLVWIIYGAYEVTRLPIDAVPDITNNQVQVITTAPALGAEDVERLITFPIELAISNIPGLKESRSLSRFGLSLITVVFEDGTDVYWARQQVNERLSQVKINENANAPNLAPVTTGLGEIYQYVVKPDKGYESRYSLSDLRTIQDWIVKRQLLGTPGVADVSTFGGELKQYEVAVNPAHLKGLDLSISDVFTALSRNNQNAGGAYIEKGPSVLFIRSIGLAGSVADIENTVVKITRAGMPILIGHIGKVQMGSAIRYGALTMAGHGELTGGIVMMLKGENSSAVIVNIKQKIQEIQQTLPEGIVIEPFLDRSKMVNNAISTVENNLLEGALIVIVVLVLFLGNFRAGLIVASVIPLSMLFAVTMMNTFGVSGNLMSLGALDFGLIVDGAVIIVEAILHHLHFAKRYGNVDRISTEQMNAEVFKSSSRMMNAAVFGQIIILIVYLPILSLSGIEGKMFKPMAQTVGFAILGAFILSITYVPMISSLFISRRIARHANLSERLMARIENVYENVLVRTLRFRKTLVAIAFGLFALAVYVFTQMGGEFIPQLEEGDFAVETRLLVGTNLTTTIKSIEQIADTLVAHYPEVEKIVSRVGSAEIPTDPMPIEGGDMIIVLKDKSAWTSAESFPELATKMAATAQHVIPGVTTGFQYPVQMRFNELMTGAKQDVVCKIFGEDLNKLAAYADRLTAIAKTVDGTADWYTEKVTGMPQIVIEYNRKEIARYGLNIDDVNRTINAAFAGASAGQLYEGEKQFNLVVRVESESRRDINHVAGLPITTPGGIQIPLYQVATIKETEGPNQIQRESSHRRIIVGFNVRGRDVESIVEELQKKVSAQIKFEAGYLLKYGGAFENLQQAKARLGLAVPAALLLIFAMLYLAFSSFKEGALIYTAIPLSAIGGVFALSLRGMPFSISAGVGFIALFGVAVLNGIVLVAEFKKIGNEGEITDPLQRVLAGTRNRLRPVLMTAAVASLGFLPMALSHGAGAEVQRPLATVVIGGLISATFLTLFVLPALYLLFDSIGNFKAPKKTALLSICLLAGSFCYGQQTSTISLNDAISLSLKRNAGLQGIKLEEEAAKKLQKSALDLPKTVILTDYGNTNSVNTDTRFGLSQSFSFPSTYVYQNRLLKENLSSAQQQTRLSEQDIRASIRKHFFKYAWLQKKNQLLLYADSLYREAEQRSTARFEKGEANILEKTSAEAHRHHITIQRNMLQADIAIVLKEFNWYLQDSVQFLPDERDVEAYDERVAYTIVSGTVSSLPVVQLLEHQAESARYKWLTERSRLMPDFTIGYNNQSLVGYQLNNNVETYYGSKHRFSYLSFGIGIPLFFNAQSARIEAAKLTWQKYQSHNTYLTQQLELDADVTRDQVIKYAQSLKYYHEAGLKSASLIVQTANAKLNAGEIDYLAWIILIEQTITLRTSYLDILDGYHQAIIQFQHLNNL